MSELSELELQMAVSCHLGVGNQSQALCESKCMRLSQLGHLCSPYSCIAQFMILIQILSPAIQYIRTQYKSIQLAVYSSPSKLPYVCIVQQSGKVKTNAL